MGKKGDLSVFECGMVVGVRRAGLSISKTADLSYWDLHAQPTLGFTEKSKRSVSSYHIKPNKLLLLLFFVLRLLILTTAYRDYVYSVY